jgi:hypothetical protein
MTHLPKAPRGSITGSGSLDNAPLAIDADFARSAAGSVDVALHDLTWKSLTGHGVITRAPEPNCLMVTCTSPSPNSPISANC